MLAGEFLLMKMIAAISAHIPVAGEKFAIRKPRLHLERVDLGHTACANDALLTRDDGLLARNGVMPAMETTTAPVELNAVSWQA